MSLTQALSVGTRKYCMKKPKSSPQNVIFELEIHKNAFMAGVMARRSKGLP